MSRILSLYHIYSLDALRVGMRIPKYVQEEAIRNGLSGSIFCFLFFYEEVVAV
jgi:hypothetical protein